MFGLAGSAQRCGPRAKGLGPLGRGPSGPLGPFGAQGPFGAFGVIPKLFRVDGHYEWMAITSGWLFRAVDGHYEWMAILSGWLFCLDESHVVITFRQVLQEPLQKGRFYDVGVKKIYVGDSGAIPFKSNGSRRLDFRDFRYLLRLG